MRVFDRLAIERIIEICKRQIEKANKEKYYLIAGNSPLTLKDVYAIEDDIPYNEQNGVVDDVDAIETIIELAQDMLERYPKED